MKVGRLDTLSTAGLWLTALASPCCFPVFAVLGSAFGLGSFELFGGATMYVFQGLVLLSVVGTALAYRQHRRFEPGALAVLSAGVIFYSYYVDFSQPLVYAGMVGLLAAAALNHWLTTRVPAPLQLTSTVTCPHCGHRQAETMPTDACQYFYECRACHTVLKPTPGDCCVFCSYGTAKCPPIQQGLGCC